VYCCLSQCLPAGAGHVRLQSRDILGQGFSHMHLPQYCLRECVFVLKACRQVLVAACFVWQ
jgi:hypothetical protein